MTTNDFEPDLREALASCTNDVPPEIGERLRRHDYHPRGPRRVVVGLAAGMVALGTVAGVIGTWTRSPGTIQRSRNALPTIAQHVPTPSTTLTTPSSSVPTITLGGSTIQLADATVQLPAGFKQVDSPCAPTPTGIEGDIPFSGNPFAAAASGSGGCIDFLLAGGATRAPAGSEPVTVGGYDGMLATDQSTNAVTLYVTIPADLDLVLTAEGLSSSQLESTAGAIIPNVARQLVALAEGPPSS